MVFTCPWRFSDGIVGAVSPEKLLKTRKEKHIIGHRAIDENPREKAQSGIQSSGTGQASRTLTISTCPWSSSDGIVGAVPPEILRREVGRSFPFHMQTREQRDYLSRAPALFKNDANTSTKISPKQTLPTLASPPLHLLSPLVLSCTPTHTSPAPLPCTSSVPASLPPSWLALPSPYKALPVRSDEHSELQTRVLTTSSRRRHRLRALHPGQVRLDRVRDQRSHCDELPTHRDRLPTHHRRLDLDHPGLHHRLPGDHHVHHY